MVAVGIGYEELPDASEELRRLRASVRQRSLQNRTSAQHRSHFFRQLNGLPHMAHAFSGSCFLDCAIYRNFTFVRRGSGGNSCPADSFHCARSNSIHLQEAFSSLRPGFDLDL